MPKLKPRVKGNPAVPLLGIQARNPVWMRVTPVKFTYGISRTEVFRLKALGEIETKLLLKPGKSRGILLVNVASLEAYLDRYNAEGAVQ